MAYKKVDYVNHLTIINDENLNKSESGVKDTTLWKIAECISNSDYTLEIGNWETENNSFLAVKFTGAVDNTKSVTIKINNENSKLLLDGNGNNIIGEDIENRAILLISEGDNFYSYEKNTSSKDSLPVGVMMAYGSDILPNKWLLCDGSAISRDEYKSLFNILGTTYGAGDGVTTFNLPNKKGLVSIAKDPTQGEFNVLGKIGGSKFLQQHTHTQNAHNHNQDSHDHGFERPKWFGADGGVDNWGIYSQQNTTWQSFRQNVSASQPYIHAVAATNQNTGSGNSQNLQPYQVDNWIIKVR